MTYTVMHGADRTTDPTKLIFREVAVNAAGELLTAAAPPANPALAPATAPNQVAQTAELLAINTATTTLAARVYNKGGQLELQPSDVKRFAPGEYHRLRWSVQPTDRRNPDLEQRASIDIGGMAARWYANQNGEHNCTETNVLDVTIDAGDARVTLVWDN